MNETSNGHDPSTDRLLANGVGRAVLDGMGEGFILLDPQFLIVEINAEGLRIDGRSREEIVGRHLLQVWPEAVELPTWPAYRKAMAENTAVTLEYRHQSEQHDVWLEVRAYPTAAGLAVFYRDITERRTVEESARESETRFGQLATAISKVFYINEAGTGRLAYLSPAYEKVWEQPAAAAMAEPRQFMLPVHPDDLPAVEDASARQLRGEATEIEYRLVFGNRIKWINDRSFVTTDPATGGTRIVGVAEDITARRLAEDRLRENETRLRLEAERVQLALAAGAIIGTWNWDLANDSFTVDEQFAEHFGLDPALGREGLSLEQVIATVHPDDVEGLRAAIAEVIARGGAYAHQYRVRNQAGAYHWIEANGRVDHAPDGTPLRFPGVLLDVDARRTMEQERDQAENLLRSFVEAVPGVVYAKDREGRMLVANRGTAELVGKPLEQIIDHTDAEFLDDAAQADAVMANDRRIMDGGAVEQIEEEVSLPDGSRAVWLSTKAPLLGETGEVVGLIGSSVDITARREAEERLRFLSTLDEKLRDSPDAATAMAAVAGLLGSHLHASRCAYAAVEDDNNAFEILADYTAPGVASSAGSYSLDLFGPRAAADMRQGKTLIVRDVAGELAPGEGREMFQAIGVDAIICCPLVRKGKLVAMMAVHQDRPRDWAAEEIAIVETAVERCWAHVERAGAAARLRDTNRRLDAVLNNTQMAMFLMDDRQHCVYANAAAEEMTGYRFEQLQGQPLHDVIHCKKPDGSHYPLEECPIDRAFPERAHMQGEELFVAPDGSFYPVAFTASPLLDDDGKPIGTVIEARNIAEDKARDAALRELHEGLERRVAEAIAERERVEEALRQSQKMEAVGQLTGGIAHDFNNLLTVVTGNIDMASRNLAAAGIEEGRIKRSLDNAMKGAERAAALTQRLLAFSRRQPLDPKPLNVDRLVVDMSDLLNRALGETVKLEVVTSPGLWRVEADPNQLESAILNLAVNARDAMPDGGTLTIETANARLDEAYAAEHAEVAPGQYVVIAVTDTGEGMSKEVVARVFEPFFTTKEVGRGTGLGLSQVYGFTKQSGGHVKVYSEEGRGTTIKIYLPRLLSDQGGEEEGESDEPSRDLSRGRETIMVVEDDDDVRAYTVDCLRDLGYQVLEAHDGPSALRLLERQEKPIDLLFTDVVMPGMTGRELADEARKLQPDLKVLYTSGYTRNAIVHGGRLDEGVEMISKPFTYQVLGEKIADMLERGQTGRLLLVEDDATVRMFAAEALAGVGYAVDEAATSAEALSRVRAARGRYDAVVLDARLPDSNGDHLAAELRAMHLDMPILVASGEHAVELTERFKSDRCTGVIAKPYNAASLTKALQELGISCQQS